LALDGGKPYIEERLSRFPAESEASWRGHAALARVRSLFLGDTQNIHGRKDRAYNLNHFGRIIQKMCQYVFSGDIKRVGIDEKWALDVTRSRLSIDQFWKKVLKIGTAARWCWVRVDGPVPPVDEDGNSIGFSVADGRDKGLNPYWSVHEPSEIVDWDFNQSGELTWLLSEGFQFDNNSPFAVPKLRKVRTLWEPGKVTFFWFGWKGGKDVNKIVSTSMAVSPPPVVPLRALW